MDQLLTAWGCQNLIQVLRDNDINSVECLHDLMFNYPSDAINVIGSAGVRMKVKQKLKDHIELNKNIIIESVEEIVLPPENHQDHTADLSLIIREDITIDPSDSSSIKEELPAFEGHSNLKRAIEEPIDETHSNIEFIEGSVCEKKTSKRKKSSRFDDLNLKEILKNHPLGPSIIKIYDCKQELDTTTQSYLCEIIAHYLLQIKDLEFNNEDFITLSDKIIEIFPLECRQTYFVPAVYKSQSRIDKYIKAKGKLIDKYRNLSTYIREAKNLNKKVEIVQVTEQNDSKDVQQALSSKKWLIINREPSEVLKHWDNSYHLRLQDAKDQNFIVLAEIYKNWPILKESSGYELIERDFLKLSPMTLNNFQSKWYKVCSIFAKISKKNLSKEERIALQFVENINENSQSDYDTYMQLTSLTTLLVPRSNKITIKGSGKSKSFWRPTKTEASEGIIIHVKTPGDVDNEVDKKRMKMCKMGLALQPFIIVVAPTLQDIQTCYVQVDSVVYEMPSLLRSIDILFKIFMTFNVSYARESENFAYFVQWVVYDYHTTSDIEIPSVCTIVNKIKKRL